MRPPLRELYNALGLPLTTVGYLIGLDYGTESARGVLIDVATGEVCAAHSLNYRHGTSTSTLPNGTQLGPGWALQNAMDYLECAETILVTLGRDKQIAAIGVGFTASSPLPTFDDGTPLSIRFPNEPHAYVKLWKHCSAQPWAEAITLGGRAFLEKSGGKTSGEWLPAKAAQLAAEAPALWAQTARFIEAGDWLVWQLIGREVRSSDMARYKAHYSPEHGYPDFGVVDLTGRLSPPLKIGSPAGRLCDEWQTRTGILGSPTVAVAAIDSHVILPALGAVETGTLVGALGTSSVFMLLDDTERSLPTGIEGVAFDAALPDLWCYEAGQAGFGDVLAWFAKTAPMATEIAENFSEYNASAASLLPGQSGLLALDWWSGCRVPLSDPDVSGLEAVAKLSFQAVNFFELMLTSCLVLPDRKRCRKN